MYQNHQSFTSSKSSPQRRIELLLKTEREQQKKIDASVATASSMIPSSDDHNNKNAADQYTKTLIRDNNTESALLRRFELQQQEEKQNFENNNNRNADPDDFIISLLQNADFKFQKEKEEQQAKSVTAKKQRKHVDTTENKHKTSSSSSQKKGKLYLDFSPAVVKTLTNMHRSAQDKSVSSHLARSSTRVKQNIGHLLLGVFGEKRLREFFANVDEFDAEGEEKKHLDVVGNEEEDEDSGVDSSSDSCDENNEVKKKQAAPGVVLPQIPREVSGASLGFLLGLGEADENGDDDSTTKNNNTSEDIPGDRDDDDEEKEFTFEIERAKKALEGISSANRVKREEEEKAKMVPITTMTVNTSTHQKSENEVDDDDDQEEINVLSTLENTASPVDLLGVVPFNENKKKKEETSRTSNKKKPNHRQQQLQTFLQTRKRTELKSLPDPSILLEMIVAEHTEMRKQSEMEEEQRYRQMIKGMSEGRHYDKDGNEIEFGANQQQIKKNNKVTSPSTSSLDPSSGFIEHFHSKLDWAIRELFQSQKTQDQIQAQYNHFVLEAARRIDTLEKTIDSLRDEKIAHEETKQELERERERSMVLFSSSGSNERKSSPVKLIEDSNNNHNSNNNNDVFSRDDLLPTRNNNNRSSSSMTPNPSTSSKFLRGRFGSLPANNTYNIQRKQLFGPGNSQFVGCDKLLLQKQEKEKLQQMKQNRSSLHHTPPPPQPESSGGETTSSSIQNNTSLLDDGDDDAVSWQEQTSSRPTAKPSSFKKQQQHQSAESPQNQQQPRTDYTELNNQMLSLTYEIATLKDENKKLKHQVDVGLAEQEKKFEITYESMTAEKESLRKALDATKEELYIAQRMKGNSSDEIQALNHMLLSLRKELAKTFDLLVVDKEKHLSDFLLATSPLQAPSNIFKEFFEEKSKEGNESTASSSSDDSILCNQLTKSWKDTFRNLLSKDPSDYQIGRLSPLEPTTTTHLMNIGLVTLNQIRSLYSTAFNITNETTQRQRAIAKTFMQTQKEVRKSIAQKKKEDEHKNSKLCSALEAAQQKLIEMVSEHKKMKSSISELKLERKRNLILLKQYQEEAEKSENENSNGGERNDNNNTVGSKSASSSRTRCLSASRNKGSTTPAAAPSSRPPSSSFRTKQSSSTTPVEEPSLSDEEEEQEETEQEVDAVLHEAEQALLLLHTNATSAAPLHDDDDDEDAKDRKNRSGGDGILGLLGKTGNSNNRSKPATKSQSKTNSRASSATKKNKKTTSDDEKLNDTLNSSKTIKKTKQPTSRASSATSYQKSKATTPIPSSRKLKSTTGSKKNAFVDNNTNSSSTSKEIETQTSERLLFDLVKEMAAEMLQDQLVSEEENTNTRRLKNQINDYHDDDGGDHPTTTSTARTNQRDQQNENDDSKNVSGATPMILTAQTSARTNISQQQMNMSAYDRLKKLRETLDKREEDLLHQDEEEQERLLRYQNRRRRRSSAAFVDVEDKSIQCGGDDNDFKNTNELQQEEITCDFEKVYSTLDEIGLDPRLLRNFKSLRLNDEMLEYVDNDDLIAAGVDLVAHRRAFFFSLGKSPDLARAANTAPLRGEEEEAAATQEDSSPEKNNDDPNWWSSAMKNKVVACQTLALETKSKYAQTTEELNIPLSILERTSDDSFMEKYRQRKEQEEKEVAAAKKASSSSVAAPTTPPRSTAPKPSTAEKPPPTPAAAAAPSSPATTDQSLLSKASVP